MTEAATTVFLVHMIGASFFSSPYVHNGPSVEQILSGNLRPHVMTSHAVASNSAGDLLTAAQDLLDTFKDVRADFLVIGLTGTVFSDTSAVSLAMIDTLEYYKVHSPETICVVIGYPPLDGGNWFTQERLFNPEYDEFRASYEVAAITEGAMVIHPWKDWRSSNIPHPGLGGMPDYHPGPESSARAALRIELALREAWLAMHKNP